MATVEQNLQTAIQTLSEELARVTCTKDMDRVAKITEQIEKLRKLAAEESAPFEIEVRGV